MKTRVPARRAGWAVVATGFVGILSLATALSSDAEDASTQAIPPICYQIDPQCNIEPLGGEETLNTFDPSGVDAGGAAGDTVFQEGDRANAETGEVAALADYKAEGWPGKPAGHHCSYPHHRSHHKRARNGVLLHHYHCSGCRHSYWSGENRTKLESYSSYC